MSSTFTLDAGVFLAAFTPREPSHAESRALLHAFKYNRATWLRADLVDFLEGALRTYYDPSQIDLVLPEPGRYPFVDHAMVDGERGARGLLVAVP